MPAIYVILIAIFAVTLSVVLAGRARTDPRTTGFAMMLAGVGIVAFTVVSAFVTGEPLIGALGVMGVAFIALGARWLRAVT